MKSFLSNQKKQIRDNDIIFNFENEIIIINEHLNPIQNFSSYKNNEFFDAK